LRLIETSGKHWKLIAASLKPYDRTSAMVRNRYLRIQRGRWLTEQGQSKNKCGFCGKLKRGHVCDMGPKLSVVTASAISPRVTTEGNFHTATVITPDGYKPRATPLATVSLTQVATKVETAMPVAECVAAKAESAMLCEDIDDEGQEPASLEQKPYSEPTPLARLGSLEMLALAAAGVAA